MRTVTLYKRNAKGNIIEWTITESLPKTFVISFGIIDGNHHIETIKDNLKKGDGFVSRINAKRKEGYKSLEDLYDNAPQNLPRKEDVIAYLDAYLPKYNTTAEGFVLPMLAKTLEDNKPFEKYGNFLGQWKINGLRCLIGAEEDKMDMFNPIRLTYTSREGTRWNLHWMDEIIIPLISKKLLTQMVEEGIYLDGELYLPGYSVNEINSFVKNNKLPQHYKLQYWCYDIAMDNFNAGNRTILLYTETFSRFFFNSKEDHLNNDKQFGTLPNYDVSTIQQAINIRNKFIDFGFEGLIVRNPAAEYAFGKRNTSMFKYKKKLDGIFKIIDIKEDKRGLPIYTLQNDINDECFECTINLPQREQKMQLHLKHELIGKKGLVEYRERSGVKQVPFHAKLITIYL